MAEKKENKNSAARIRANNAYNAKAYDRINIAIKKGRKEVIAATAAAEGKTINSFVVEAIEAALKKRE